MPTLPRSRPLTVEDFEAVRDVDDGHRYELIDGALIVTPSPVPVHQRVVVRLVGALSPAAEGSEVFVAPLDVRLGPDTVVQPDVLVTASEALTSRGVVGAPLLAVEVLSPSTRHIDLGLKRSRYEAAACPAYWVVDPDVPSLRVWELHDGSYRLVCEVQGDGVAALTRPWPVRLVPTDLVRP